MTWFKVDDGFYDHPKVLGLDVAAVGLWTLAGSYCARHLTDGVISERQIRAIGGTRRQAEKLVAAGLWSVDEASASARRYVFNDWRDFQPTRDDVLSKREEARRRMADARAKKAQTSENEKMFARTNPERSQEVRQSDLRERSPYPDPTRPDPTRPIGVEVSSQPYGGNAREAGAAGEFFPDDPELDGVALRARHTGVPEAAIRAGVARFTAKPTPKGPGLLHTLIAEAAKQYHAEAEEHAAKQARRAAIEACEWCDQNGIAMAETPGGGTVAVKCDHAGPPEPPPTPAPEPPRNPARSVLEMWGEIKTQKGENP